MDKTDIAVWSYARTSSTRCKEKMIRPFSDTSLTDIILKKLSNIDANVFFAGYESIFKEKCQLNSVPFIQRTKESAENNDSQAQICNFLYDQPYEYFLLVNACLPFLKTESISKFLDICAEDDKPKFAVLSKKNYFTDANGKPYNFDYDVVLDTKKVSPVNEFAHTFYFFKKSYFVEHGRFWDWKDVRYIEIDDNIEVFDIDTEDQFKTAEAIWSGLNFGGKK